MILDCGYHTGGTLGIVLLNNNLENVFKFQNNSITKFIKSALAVTISAQIFIIPIMLLNFNQISTLFWLANLLAAPIIGIATIYGFIVIFLSLISTEIAHICAIPLEFLINILMFIANKVASISFSNLLISTPKLIFIITYYFVIFYLLFKRKIKKHIIEQKIMKVLKNLIILILIISLLLQLISQIERKITINFIDVGQGDSCLIRTETRKKILIDGGGSETYDVGENVLLPYLLDRGITTLDYVLISHFDSDHCKRNINING